MYKLIDIINNTSLDDIILDTWNLNRIGIEASAIKRYKGYLDIRTSYQFEYSWKCRISFTEALRLLNHYNKQYDNRGRTLDKFFNQCNKTDGLLEAINIIKNLK